MNTEKQLVYICAKCGVPFEFHYQSSMDAFKELHTLQHELAIVKHQFELDYTAFDKKFLKDCGVAL